jgi:hypothetical protein
LDHQTLSEIRLCDAVIILKRVQEHLLPHVQSNVIEQFLGPLTMELANLGQRVSYRSCN